MRRYLLVALGGGLGSLLRFGVGEWMAPLTPWNPLATLLINIRNNSAPAGAGTELCAHLSPGMRNAG